MKREILKRTESSDYPTYLKLIEENRMLEARVFSFNKKPGASETVRVDKEDSVIFIHQTVTYGVSTSLKRYTSRKVDGMTIINLKKKTFYRKGDTKKLFPLIDNNIIIEEAKEFIYGEFPFLKYLKEYRLNIPFNTVFKNKLFTFKKALAWYYQTQYTETLAKIHESHALGNNRKEVLYNLRSCVNLHRANLDLLGINHVEIHRGRMRDDYLLDCTRMAFSLNRKIDLTWTRRRLEEEHDNMSNIITNMLFGADDRPLKISDIFLEFPMLDGWQLISTTKALAWEGMRQRHCVGTYGNQIESGQCAIYHVEGYTLQLTRDRVELPTMRAIPGDGTQETIRYEVVHEKFFGLKINQFRGHSNNPAPNELRELVQQQLDKFNLKLKEDGKKQQELRGLAYTEPAELPF